MRTFLFFIALVCFATCTDKQEDKELQKKEIAAESITHDMGCENCGMNLRKYISTSHAVKMKNGDPHFYCSINCSTVKIAELNQEVESVFAIDYNSTKFIPAENAFYVIGSNLRGTMTQVSKFAFKDLDEAEEFSKTFKGKEIANYQTAYDMSAAEIESRIK